MAVTKTFTENMATSYRSTWTLTISTINQTVSTDTFELALPTATAKYVYSGKNYAAAWVYTRIYIGGLLSGTVVYNRGDVSAQIPTTSGTTYTLGKTNNTMGTERTQWIFNSSNPTVRTVNVTAVTNGSAIFQSSKNNADMHNQYDTNAADVSLGTLGTITLDAPPTFTASIASEGPYYQNAIQYTVNVSSLSAKYGGTISEVKLTIGSQSVTRSDNGALVITPQNVGTYTPTITVTDSRGQVTTQALDNITVLANTIGISNLSAQRINANGLLDDEGTNAIVTFDANYTAFTGNYLQEPTVTINGTATSNVTWYETWDNTNGFSDAVNWTNYAPSSPKTLYGKVTDTFTDSLSYQIGVSASTTYAQSSTITTTLAQAFYLLVGRAGGKGLGIGMKPPTDALHIGMKAYSPSMTTTELNDFLDSLNRDFRGSVDWIVEEGTSGIWTYRKWDSGTVELWGNGTVASSSITLNVLSSSANLYYTNSISLTLPFAVTNGAVSISVGTIAANVGWATNQRLADSTHAGFTVVKYSSTAGDMTYSIYVIGRWK